MKEDKIPDEVPNWYLFKQNREIQRQQLILLSFFGITIALVAGIEILQPPGFALLAIAIAGVALEVVGLLKYEALGSDGVARRVCRRLGIATSTDAEAKIAERNSGYERQGGD